MKALLGAIAAVFVFTSPVSAQQASKVTINEIIANDHIRGTVSGMSAAEMASHCVVVYVHTDQWYIHPFANGGDGKSWASIQPSGSWSIDSVRREFAADRVAVIVLPRSVSGDCEAPARLTAAAPSVTGQVAVENKLLKGTPDYNKL